MRSLRFVDSFRLFGSSCALVVPVRTRYVSYRYLVPGTTVGTGTITLPYSTGMSTSVQYRSCPVLAGPRWENLVEI